MRKLIIGLSAVVFVASLFFGYALIMDAEPIEVCNVTESDNLEMPESGDAAQQAGDTDVRVAKAARYVVLDPETKEISRVFGFDNLLNPGMDTSRREVEKPYMIFYESNFQCRIDADTGMFQVETSGSSSTPKDARLNGNVKIHVMPKPGSKMSETIVEMDDLVFSSERSEFATDRKVYIKSDQVELKGTGLIVIFDPASGRIDYLRIRDLEEIRMQGLTDPKSGTKTTDAEMVAKTKSEQVVPTQKKADSMISSEKTDEAEVELTPSLRYYQCILEDNIEIKYGNELVVAGADQVNIQNILFSKLDQSPETDALSERVKDTPKTVAKSGQPSDKKTESKIEPETEVLVTCDGGIILKPMEDEDAEQMPVAQAALSVGMGNTPLRIAKIIPDSRQTPAIGMANLVGEEDAVAKSDTATTLPASNTVLKSVLDPNAASPPTKFEARKIDYDLLTGSGLAHGPVRFTFYQDPDPNSTTPKSWIPITVTADENARFIADESGTINQVVFNENVLAERRSQQTELTQLDHLHGNKLTISLDENAEGNTDISHISMTEGRVYVQSQKLKDEQLLSNVKLYCTEIAYSQTDDEILAKGPGGEIQLDNSHIPDPNTSEESDGIAFDQPCYVYIGGFDQIKWNLTEQKIVADGQEDQLKLAYIPLKGGKSDKYIFVNSIRFDLSFLTDSTGRPVLKRVFTDKPITYEEWNSDQTKRLHHIEGQSLDYDSVDGDGWIKIAGAPAVPCNVDNMRMPEVLVHPVTGEIKASISTRPGVLKGR